MWAKIWEAWYLHTFKLPPIRYLQIVPEMIKINIPYNKTQPLIWCSLEDFTLILVFLTKIKINLEEGNITQTQIKISHILFLTLNYNLDLLWAVITFTSITNFSNAWERPKKRRKHQVQQQYSVYSRLLSSQSYWATHCRPQNQQFAPQYLLLNEHKQIGWYT